MKTEFSYDFCWRKKHFWPIIYAHSEYFSIFEDGLTLYVIVTPYEHGWYLFWYQWIEETHRQGYWAFSKGNHEGYCINPAPFGGRVTDKGREDKG